MPRYYFHSVEIENYRDGEGIELPNVSAARSLAVRYAGELLGDISEALFDTNLRVQVTDDAGLPLFSIMVVATEAAMADRPLVSQDS